MTYSCTDFTDSILVALGITNVPQEAMDDPAAQAYLALNEIGRLQKAETSGTAALQMVADLWWFIENVPSGRDNDKFFTLRARVRDMKLPDPTIPF